MHPPLWLFGCLQIKEEGLGMNEKPDWVQVSAFEPLSYCAWLAGWLAG